MSLGIIKVEASLDFARLVNDVRKALINGHVISVDYSNDSKRGRVIENNPLLTSARDEEANMYAIWKKKKTAKNWKLMYIGQTKTKYIYYRLINHLFHKDPNTGSKLHEILDSVKSGYMIGVTLASVYPEELRTSVEERLIRVMKEGGACPWNIKG